MEYLPEADRNGSYINDRERNVHVWCSIMKRCSSVTPKLRGEPTLGLVAGCYVHKGWPSVSVFYKWIGDIVSLSEEPTNLALFHCKDPRGLRFPVGPIPLPSAHPLDKRLTKTIEEGHYMLFRYDKAQNSFLPVWPELESSNFKRRSRSASQTCTPSPNSNRIRDTQTRIKVRMRDRRCIVTGQAAVGRARGGNFTGLEVAHIFPLMAVGKVEWTELMSASARRLVLTSRLADQPENAILLRADIHSLFDDYQWSIWTEPGNKPTITRFEKSGAVVLEQYDSVDISPSKLSTAPPPNLELIRAHFRVALLIHVRGVGKRATAGFKATQL